MKKILSYIRQLEAPIEDAIAQLHTDCFGYPPDKVECVCLRNFDMTISLERHRSPTEQFLLKSGYSEMATDVGLSANNILKKKVFSLLIDDFDIPVVELSFFKPALPEKFGLFAVLQKED